MSTPLFAIKYIGPKHRKTLWLPVGIVSRSEIEYQANFEAPDKQCLIPAQYIGAVVANTEHYKFANVQAQKDYLDWCEATLESKPAVGMGLASYIPTLQEAFTLDDVGMTVTTGLVTEQLPDDEEVVIVEEVKPQPKRKSRSRKEVKA